MYSLQHSSTPGAKNSGTIRCKIHIHNNHFFVSIRYTINHTSTRFLSLIFHFFIHIVHVAPGSLIFTRASILFFSSSLCFAAIFGHSSLFYGMDFRNVMVSRSGCFDSHFAAPCLVSCPMIITGRCMVLLHLDSSSGL